MKLVMHFDLIFWPKIVNSKIRYFSARRNKKKCSNLMLIKKVMVANDSHWEKKKEIMIYKITLKI
jgi:hypothetical protein